MKFRTAYTFLFLFLFCMIGHLPSQNSASVQEKNLALIDPSNYNTFNQDLQDLLFRFSVVNTYEMNTNMYKKIKGTPYLFKQYVPGRIILKDGRALKGVQLNFDTYEGKFIAKNDQGNVILLDSKFITQVLIDHNGEQYDFKKIHPGSPEQFCQVFYDKNGCMFYKSIDTEIKAGTNNGILNESDQFKTVTQYFVRNDEQRAKSVNLKKDNILEYIPEADRIVVNEVMKNKKIKLKKESDYLALFASLEN